MNQSDVSGMLHRVVLVIAGLVALAACTPKPAPVPEAPPPPVVAAPEPEPEVVAPVEQPKHEIALLVPVTGQNAPIGQSIANAATLALLDLNNPRLKLTTYDTTAGTVSAAQRALASGAKFILGPLSAANTREVEPLAARAKVPMISFSNDADLADADTFVFGFLPSQEIERVVAFAAQQGVTRYAAMVPGGTYGQRVGEAYAAAVRRHGGQLVLIETFPRDRTKLVAAARRVARYDDRMAQARARLERNKGGAVRQVEDYLQPPPYEALLIAEASSFTRALLPALAQYGVTNAQVRLLGPGLWSTDTSLAAEPGMQGAWFASVPDGQFSNLSRRLRSQFGLRASRFASFGYDAILLAHTGDQNGWRIGQPFPVSALTSEGGYTGIDGLFRLLPGGVTERGLEVKEMRGGEFITVSPRPNAFPPVKPVS